MRCVNSVSKAIDVVVNGGAKLPNECTIKMRLVRPSSAAIATTESNPAENTNIARQCLCQCPHHVPATPKTSTEPGIKLAGRSPKGAPAFVNIFGNLRQYCAR